MINMSTASFRQFYESEPGIKIFPYKGKARIEVFTVAKATTFCGGTDFSSHNKSYSSSTNAIFIGKSVSKLEWQSPTRSTSSPTTSHTIFTTLTISHGSVAFMSRFTRHYDRSVSIFNVVKSRHHLLCPCEQMP